MKFIKKIPLENQDTNQKTKRARLVSFKRTKVCFGSNFMVYAYQFGTDVICSGMVLFFIPAILKICYPESKGFPW